MLVNGESAREVVSVTGTGGLGKTTLVRKVYDDVEVKKHFKPRAWITVSHSFEAQDLLKDIIRKLYSEIGRRVPEGVDSMSSHKLKVIIKNLLQKRRYLIVLDDVWRINEWETVKYAFPNGNLGSRVMITTRKSDVASTSCSESGGYVYKVRPLPATQSWNLFTRKAFQGNSCPYYLKQFCEDIIRKCEGLPLAIVAISGVLATKDERRIDEWYAISRCLGAEIHGNDKLEDLKKVLSLSFNDLPYNLKACFLCLSVFPEGHLIKRMKTIRLWIAEGFVEAREGRTLEEVAEDYLQELFNRNLMLVGSTTSDGRVKTYRIHGLLRGIIVSKARDQNFAAIVKEHNTIWPDRSRRLSIHNVLQTVHQSRSFPQLRSLFTFGAVSRSSMRKNLSNGFRLLRVLDIEAAPIKKFPVEIMDLFFLSYLSLRRTRVEVIPRSIGNLQNLETLDLKHTSVSELPIEIRKLHKLRHLLIYHLKIESYAHFYSKFGVKVLSSIGDLQSLQKLCFIEADQGSGMIIRELAKLKQLRRLGIIKLRKEDGLALCSSLESLTKLRSFSVNSVGEDEIIDLQQMSSPPQFLERLYLTCRMEELPSWIPSLRSLVKLMSKWSQLKDDPMVLLQDLPNLVHLELLQTCVNDMLSFKRGGFKKLKVLGLDKFDKLSCVKMEKGTMPCLERLTIQRCKLLKRVPSGVRYLSKLKSLQFFDMPYELISKLLPNGVGEDYKKVAHIPEVYSAYWRDGGWDVYPIDNFKEIESSISSPGTVRRGHDFRPLQKTLVTCSLDNRLEALLMKMEGSTYLLVPAGARISRKLYCKHQPSDRCMLSEGLCNFCEISGLHFSYLIRDSDLRKLCREKRVIKEKREFMAESAVKFLLDKLAPLFENDLQLLRGGVREEIVYLRGELERMTAFLRVADASEESDEELKVWVKQLRDIAHDSEDVLDEFTLLQTHDHGEGLYGSIHRFSCCIKNTKGPYRIASELKGINLRIKKISEVHKRLRHKFNMAEQGEGSNGACNTWDDHQGDALLLEKTDIVGIDKPMKQLVGWLVKGDSGREVVSVVGIGGMGKTTLAKQVYNAAEGNKHFKFRAWITVTPSFKLGELLKDMVHQLHNAIRRPVPEGIDTMNTNNLKTIIKGFLQKRRYLIVLDDVSHLHGWNAVKYALPNNTFGSRVIVTTRDAKVASTTSVESGGKVYNLEPLPQTESWELLCKKTFQGKACPLHLKEICTYALKKCEGMPLAIVAVSGVLSTKDHRRMDEWDIFCHSLGAEIQGNDRLRDLKKVLSLSFNDLPYYLKSCFLYLRIFPEDYLIEHMRLVRLWMAEGFVEPKDGKTLEDVSEDYLSELLNRGMIQAADTTSDGRVKNFRVHDLFREMITSKIRDQNFATISKEQNVPWPDKVRRLSLHNSMQYVQKNRCVSQLRSLIIFRVPEKPLLQNYFPGGFRLLNVLDLQNAALSVFPVEVINLFFLKYLSLRGTKVKAIPRFIGKLQNLETLDLKHSQVTELPVEILKLEHLRHLLVYRYGLIPYGNFHSKYGVKVPVKIGALTSLQKLCFIKANEDGGTILKELGQLVQLRRLGIVQMRKEYGRVLCSSMKKLNKLCALSITSVEEDEIIDLQHLSSPPPLLQRLYLRGRLMTIPHWIPSLLSLVRLYLKWCRLKDDPLVFLQYLPNLVHLELSQVFEGETLCFAAGGFKKLKHLGIDEFKGLKSIQVQLGAMPSVKKLSIQRCKLLEKVPSGIEHLNKLKVLKFFDMPGTLIKTLRPHEKDNDYWKVAHIPEVYFTYWKECGWEVYPLEGLSEGENFPYDQPSSVMKSHELETRWK